MIENTLDERRRRPRDGAERGLFDLSSSPNRSRRPSWARNHRRRSVLVALPDGISARRAEAVAAEVPSVDLGPEGAADAAPQLIRTRAIVDEALRLYPPAFVNRPPGVCRRPRRRDPCARAVAGPGRPPGSCTGAVGFGTNRRPLIRSDSYLTLATGPFRLSAVRRRPARMHRRTVRTHRTHPAGGDHVWHLLGQACRISHRQADRDRQHSAGPSTTLPAAASRGTARRVALSVAKVPFCG